MKKSNQISNHSNNTGAFLTAAVLYEVITQNLAKDLPHINSINIDTNIQKILREVASKTVEQLTLCLNFPR